MITFFYAQKCKLYVPIISVVPLFRLSPVLTLPMTSFNFEDRDLSNIQVPVISGIRKQFRAR